MALKMSWDLNTSEPTANTFYSPLKHIEYLSKYQNPELWGNVEVFKDTGFNFKESIKNKTKQKANKVGFTY